MADEGRSSGVVDQRPQTQVLHWQDLFSAALDLLEECEREWNTAEVGVRENVQIRLAYLIVALQQVLPFISINSAVLNEILGNICRLHGQWIRHDSSNCTNLAVYSETSPEVFRSGSVRRPSYLISEEVLLHLRSSGFTWTKIAQMLLVSRWTLRHRIVEYGLEEITGFSMISDAQLNNLVERFMSDHGTLVGYSLVSGHLRSLGRRVPRDQIRESIGHVDPGNSRVCWAVVISRRAYSVAGPNSLWHIDRHHSLVTWGFVIHGGIDGFSRLIIFFEMFY